MADKPFVLVICSSTIWNMTRGRFIFAAEMLKRAGMDVAVCVWNPEAFQFIHQKGLFAVSPQTSSPAMHSEERIAASKEAWELLNWGIDPRKPDSPTWARLLALDDVLGSVQYWDIQGLEILRPDVIVKAVQGAESSEPLDEVMEGIIGRWAMANSIPVVALESQRVDGELAMKWPVDTLLMQQPLARFRSGYYRCERLWRLPPRERFLLSLMDDPLAGAMLERYDALREQYGLVDCPGVIFLPFHLYYQEACMKALERLGRLQQRGKIPAGWRVVVICGESSRRSYKERLIVDEGMKAKWKELGDIHIAENGDMVHVAAMADVVVAAYESMGIWQFSQRWGLNVWDARTDSPPWERVLDEAQRQRGLVAAVRDALERREK